MNACHYHGVTATVVSSCDDTVPVTRSSTVFLLGLGLFRDYRWIEVKRTVNPRPLGLMLAIDWAAVQSATFVRNDDRYGESPFRRFYYVYLVKPPWSDDRPRCSLHIRTTHDSPRRAILIPNVTSFGETDAFHAVLTSKR